MKIISMVLILLAVNAFAGASYSEDPVGLNFSKLIQNSKSVETFQIDIATHNLIVTNNSELYLNIVSLNDGKRFEANYFLSKGVDSIRLTYINVAKKEFDFILFTKSEAGLLEDNRIRVSTELALAEVLAKQESAACCVDSLLESSVFVESFSH